MLNYVVTLPIQEPANGHDPQAVIPTSHPNNIRSILMLSPISISVPQAVVLKTVPDQNSTRIPCVPHPNSTR